MPYSITREEAALDLQALRSILSKTDKDKANYPAWYRLAELADSIEEQVKPPKVEEPEAFGSIVRATEDYGTWLWQKTPMHGKHYWESETGAVTVWSELSDIQVLRVGIGEPQPVEELVGVLTDPDWDPNTDYLKVVEDFAAKVRREIAALRSTVVTGPEKRTCDDALALVAALLGES